MKHSHNQGMGQDFAAESDKIWRHVKVMVIFALWKITCHPHLSGSS